MHAKRVRSAEDVERLRVLRNETSKFMTDFTDEITVDMQKSWWEGAPRRCWLFGDVGFGCIRREDGVNWITLGVTEAARGQGLGTIIYRTLGPAYARIRIDNEASVRAATKAGYLPVYADEEAGFVVMTSCGQ